MLEFYPESFVRNKYLKWYDAIVQKRLTDPISRKEYGEDHHIIPKSIVKNNLKVRVTAREHYILHVLLPKFTTGKERTKMLYAIYGLIHFGGNRVGAQRENAYKVQSGKVYETAKKEFSRIHSENQKENNSFKGKNHSEETKAILRELALKRDPSTYKNNGSWFKTPEGRKISSETLKKTRAEGKLEVTEEIRNKIRQSKIGTTTFYDPSTGKRSNCLPENKKEGWISAKEYRKSHAIHNPSGS